jgi:single-strand DNA-binding protein
MQSNMLVGNLAKPAALTGNGDRAVAIHFTAFGQKAEVIARHAMKGDQLIVNYRVENNAYAKDGEQVYGFNFIIENFKFGAPGTQKREQFTNRAGD